MTKKEIIIGIDQSITGTGWFVDRENYGVIKPKKRELGDIRRIIEIREELKEIFKKYKPTIVVMENYSFGSKFRGAFLGELGGMIKIVCHDMGLKLILIPPTKLKMFMTGKGNSKKEVMLLYCYKNYGFETIDNNIADAFSLYQLYKEYMEWKEGKKYSTKKVECFKKVDKNGGT